MRQIKLHSQKYPGLFALVDDEDFDRINQYRWFISFYKRKNRFQIQRNYIDPITGHHHPKLHREVLSITDPFIHLDHINHNIFDNQKHNLRQATQFQNMRNMKIRKGGTSQYKGVSRFRDKWQAHIRVNRKTMYLGLFDVEKEGAKAYDKAAQKYYGEYKNINFPNKNWNDFLIHVLQRYNRKQKVFIEVA